jgi:hypothetical protein
MKQTPVRGERSREIEPMKKELNSFNINNVCVIDNNTNYSEMTS